MWKGYAYWVVAGSLMRYASMCLRTAVRPWNVSSRCTPPLPDQHQSYRRVPRGARDAAARRRGARRRLCTGPRLFCLRSYYAFSVTFWTLIPG